MTPILYNKNRTARIGAQTPDTGLTTTERVRFDMAKKILPTPEQLRELLRYEPETGKLYWKTREEKWFKETASRSRRHTCSNWNAKYSGKEAFTATGRDGYKASRINGVGLIAHRVVWAMIHGYWPDGQIDHINGDKIDNRASNLRLATSNQNIFNRSMYRDNASGFKGVHLDKSTGLWRSQITAYGKKKQLGSFSTPEAAHEAYCRAADKIHGEFARY